MVDTDSDWIAFERGDQATEWTIRDTIENRFVTLQTAEPTTLVPIEHEPFAYPVDTVRRFTTTSFSLDKRFHVRIHDQDGTTAKRIVPGEHHHLEHSTETVGLNGQPILYVAADHPGTVTLGHHDVSVDFEQPTVVTLGVRSTHTTPATTITTTEDPASIMNAVSMATTAMKTMTPDRSWPTLRGHPPLIERGNALEIPDSLSKPNTEITITVPPTLEAVYTVAPLAYYLGADLVSGSSAAIETPRERYQLGTSRPLEAAVERRLQHVFVLDCFVRSAGIVKDRLNGADALEEAAPFDFETIYAAPIATQLEGYLEVPFEMVEPHIPPWPATAFVPETPETAELVPLLLDQFALIKPLTAATGFGQSSETSAVDSSLSVPESTLSIPESTLSIPESILTKRTASPSADQGEAVSSNPGGAQRLEGVFPHSLEHVWFGPGIPAGMSRATVASYRRRLDREPASEETRVQVVCNEAEMLSEVEHLEDLYADRDVHPFDVQVEYGVSTDRLTTLLTSSAIDLFHFIGHASPDGLTCHDGLLDVRTLEAVSIDAFILNACRSAQQGLALVDGGAHGGLATHSDLLNERAIRAGETLSRFLSRGLRLHDAVQFTALVESVGEYSIIGDGTITIAQSDGSSSALYLIDSFTDPVSLCSFELPLLNRNLGSTAHTGFPEYDGSTLAPVAHCLPAVPLSALKEDLQWSTTPVIYDGKVHWPPAIGLPEELHPQLG
ncbi:hypothetical protein ACLI4R_00685 [Natrialbaceae archaeon A-chndr2]